MWADGAVVSVVSAWFEGLEEGVCGSLRPRSGRWGTSWENVSGRPEPYVWRSGRGTVSNPAVRGSTVTVGGRKRLGHFGHAARLVTFPYGLLVPGI